MWILSFTSWGVMTFTATSSWAGHATPITGTLSDQTTITIAITIA